MSVWFLQSRASTATAGKIMPMFYIKFEVPGDCIPKQRAQIGRFGAYYKDRPAGSRRLSYLEYRELVQAQASRALQIMALPDYQRMKAFDAPWGISVKARLGRGDADNVLGSVMDALIGILWKDDAQVLQATVTLERVSMSAIRRRAIPKAPRGVDVEAWILEPPAKEESNA